MFGSECSGTVDTVYARSTTGTASYSWSTGSNENIIGTPRWDTVSNVHYVYVATTGVIGVPLPMSVMA